MARRYKEHSADSKKQKEKKKSGCGGFFFLMIFFVIIAGVGLFFYSDYTQWKAQKEKFDGMVNAGKEIVRQTTTEMGAKSNLKILINQTKKNTTLTNLKASVAYAQEPAVWASGNDVTLTFSGNFKTNNPFLESSIKAEETITLVCASEKLTMIPGFVDQTGIKGDYTNYNYFYEKWHDDTNQRAIADKWNSSGRTQSNDIATLGGYYLVAVRPIFGNCGDILCVVLEDGTSFDCMIADEKGDDAGNDWGHYKGSHANISLVEFEVIGNDNDSLAPNFTPPAEWEGKKVSAIINKGPNIVF